MRKHMIGITGIPYDAKSSFLKGAAKGPSEIRKILNDGSSSFVTDRGIELEEGEHYKDLGNITVKNYMKDIEKGIVSAFKKAPKIITLGGDHSITYPIIKAYKTKFRTINILQLDAHTDLYDEFEGDKYSHACPFARIMEDKLAKRLVQVGIRVVSEHQKEQQKRYGVRIITMRDWLDGVRPTLNNPVYISLDLDVFDPGFAPGVSHYEPGGLSPREVIELILNIDVPIIGADVVEYNPSRDHHGITGNLAAKLLKELIGKMYMQ